MQGPPPPVAKAQDGLVCKGSIGQLRKTVQKNRDNQSAHTSLHSPAWGMCHEACALLDQVACAWIQHLSRKKTVSRMAGKI